MCTVEVLVDGGTVFTMRFIAGFSRSKSQWIMGPHLNRNARIEKFISL